MSFYGSSKTFPEDIECVMDPVNGKGGIYISNVEAAQNLKTLKKYGIEAVLTAAYNIKLKHTKNQIPYYKHIPGKDHQQFNLSIYFDQSVQFIHNALEKTNILVHCMAGVSRSVTLVLAYLIKKKGMRYDDAYSMVKSKRRIIHPNSGFIEQLRKYDSQLNKSNKRAESPSRITSGMSGILTRQNVQMRRSQYESPLKKYQSSTYYDSSPLKRFYETSGKLSRYQSPLKKYESRIYEPQPLHNSNRFLNPQKISRGLSGLKYTSDRFSHLVYPTNAKPQDYSTNDDYIEKRVAQIKKKQSLMDDYRKSGHIKSKSIIQNYPKSNYLSNYQTASMRNFDSLGMKKLSSMYDYLKY